MTTTAVFAEILIVGLEAEAVLALLLLAIFGLDSVEGVDLSDWTSLVTLLVFAAAYVLGILVDRLADSASAQLKRTAIGEWINEHFGEGSRNDPRPDTVAAMRLTVMAAGGDLAKFIEYQRSRMRIARGTMVNALVSLFVVPAFLIRIDAGAGRIVVITAVVAGVSALSVFASERIESAWIKRLSEAYLLIRAREAAP